MGQTDFKYHKCGTGRTDTASQRSFDCLGLSGGAARFLPAVLTRPELKCPLYPTFPGPPGARPCCRSSWAASPPQPTPAARTRRAQSRPETCHVMARPAVACGMHHTACDERTCGIPRTAAASSAAVCARISSERQSAPRTAPPGVERHKSIAARSDGIQTKATLQGRAGRSAHATLLRALASARRSAVAHPAPRSFVCLFLRRTSKKIATKKFIDWQYPTLALRCAYLSTPRVLRQYPSVSHESRSRTSSSGTARYCGVLRSKLLTRRGPTGASSTLARTRRARASGTCGGGRARSPRCAAEGLYRMLQRGTSTALPAVPH